MVRLDLGGDSSPRGRHVSEPVLEHDRGAARSRAVQVQAVTADVVQRAGGGIGVLVVCPGSGLVHPADGADGERGDDRVEQPANTAAEAAAKLDDHPHGEREHYRWPHPPGRVERLIVGLRDQQYQPGDSHEDCRHSCPALRLAGEAARQHGEHRPAAGEREQRRAGDDVLVGAAEDAEREHERSQKPAASEPPTTRQTGPRRSSSATAVGSESVPTVAGGRFDR